MSAVRPSGFDSAPSASYTSSLDSQHSPPRREPLPHLVPCRPREGVSLPNYAVHPVVKRHQHSRYETIATTNEGNASRDVVVGRPSAKQSGTRNQGGTTPAKAPLHIRDGSWRTFLERDECVAREGIEFEEVYEAVATIKYPAPWQSAASAAGGTSSSSRSGSGKDASPHPAQMRGAAMLARLESYERGVIEGDYADFFRQRTFRDAHRLAWLAVSQFDRAETHLRDWIACFRARKVLSALRIEKLIAQEDIQRRDWLMLSDVAQERELVPIQILCSLEALYRVEIERLYLATAHATAVIGVRLAERAEALRVFFGGPMRAAKTCGRLSGITVFSTLALEERHARASIEASQVSQIAVLPVTFAMITLQELEEPKQRREIEQSHEEAAATCFRMAVVLEAQYSLRDVEQHEAVARQQLAELMKTTVGPRDTGAMAMIPDDDGSESSDSDEDEL